MTFEYVPIYCINKKATIAYLRWRRFFLLRVPLPGWGCAWEEPVDEEGGGTGGSGSSSDSEAGGRRAGKACLCSQKFHPLCWLCVGAGGGATGGSLSAARRRARMRLRALRDNWRPSPGASSAGCSSSGDSWLWPCSGSCSPLDWPSASVRTTRALVSRPRDSNARESLSTSFCKSSRKEGSKTRGMLLLPLFAILRTARGCVWLLSWSSGVRLTDSFPLIIAGAISARASISLTTKQWPRFFKDPSQDLTDQTYKEHDLE